MHKLRSLLLDGLRGSPKNEHISKTRARSPPLCCAPPRQVTNRLRRFPRYRNINDAATALLRIGLSRASQRSILSLKLGETWIRTWRWISPNLRTCTQHQSNLFEIGIQYSRPYLTFEVPTAPGPLGACRGEGSMGTTERTKESKFVLPIWFKICGVITTSL